MYIESDMRDCPSKMYIMIQLLKLTCGKYFDGINCDLYTKKFTDLCQFRQHCRLSICSHFGWSWTKIRMIW